MSCLSRDLQKHGGFHNPHGDAPWDIDRSEKEEEKEKRKMAKDSGHEKDSKDPKKPSDTKESWHKGVPRFVCQKCSMTFYTMAELTMHKNANQQCRRR